jgi:predicted acyltransferase
VLHGIAAGYLIAFTVALKLRPRMQAAVLAVLLLAYWTVLESVPVPGVGAGVLTPDGNVPTWVDRLVLGRFHYGENTWFMSYAGFASSLLSGVASEENRGAELMRGEKPLILVCGVGEGILLVPCGGL